MHYKYPIITAFLLCISCILFGQDTTAHPPKASFTSNIQGGCAPIVVTFKDQSTGNPTSWFWDFGNGATSTRQNPSATYFVPGPHTVTLTVTNADGSDSVTIQDYITVYDLPDANFTSNSTFGCRPYPIQFMDSSTTATGTTNTSWFWYFGDGTQSTEQNPAHEYQTPGKFAVTLKVTSDKGCFKVVTKPYYVEIIPGVKVDFTSSPPVTCRAPSVVNFTNKSTGPGTLTYNWIFADDNSSTTTKNTSHTFMANGTFPVSLAVTSSAGCSDTLVKNVDIGSFKTDFTAPVVCEEKRITLIDSSSPAPVHQLWILPDGTTDSSRRPSFIFPNSGAYDIKLINDFGSCKDSVTKSITIAPKPTVNFMASDTAKCQPSFTVNFSNQTDGVSYQWDFGDNGTSTDANPSHTYTTAGIFPVTLIATNAQGCIDTITKQDFIKIQKPTVTFTNLPQGGCAPFSISPEAAVSSVDQVVAYSWNFGDGGTSTSEKPTYTYTQTGTYTVTLTVTTSSGCTETFTLEKAVKVGTKPVVDFTVDEKEVCAMKSLHFTDLSTPKDSVDQWLWQFGDGGSATTANPAYQFSDTGYLDVKLIVFNNGCSSDTLTKNQFVYIKGPVASFEYQPNCDKKTEYTFTDKSVGAFTWSWSFGDGSPKVTGKDPGPHTFPARNRSYNVSLTVTNPNGCDFTTTRTVSLFDNVPDFTTESNTGCKPFRTQITPTSTNVAAISQFVWDFGNGTTGSGNPGVPTYADAGDYTVTLTAIDSFGCKTTKVKPNFIRVNGPTARIVSENHLACKGATVLFADSSLTDGMHPVVEWKWDFGDSTFQTYTQPPFQHTYDTIGDFDVKLVVTDAAGCTDALTEQAFVRTSVLKAAWSADSLSCPGGAIQFTNATTSVFPIISNWHFGNGDTSSQESPSYTYMDTGYFTPTLIVKNIAGCLDSLVRPQYIHIAQPRADFTANNFASYCTPFEAIFTNTSYFYNSLLWDLGTGTSQDQEPHNFYFTTGTYPVKLTITSPGGCTNTITKEVKIYNPSDAKFTYAPAIGCRPVLTNFEAFSPINGRFVWDFRDGTVIDTTVNAIQHLYDEPGNYVPRVILSEPSGSCVIPLIGREVIRIYGAKIRFGIDKLILCDSGIVRFTDSTISNGNATYNWQLGDGTTETIAGNFTHQYNDPGIYSILLTVRTEHDCIDSLRKGPIKIVQSPLISIVGDSVICVNDRLRQLGVLNRPDTSAVQWVWRFPNGNTAFVQNPSNQQYTVAGNFVVSAMAINSSGCTDTAYKPIYVNPLPTVTMPATLTKQVGIPITIPATYTPNVVSYNWLPVENLSCTDCPQPIANNKFNTKYTVSFIDSNGCRNTGSIQIIVVCPNANVFVPNTFSPNGDGSNDVFYVRGRGLERVKSLRIFNRWGEVVFENRDFGVNDASGGWNGRYKNSPPQPDVYVYQLEVYCENGDIIRFDGNVALIQ